MKRDILANWFHEIRVTKTQMPIELPLILRDNESDSINAAIDTWSTLTSLHGYWGSNYRSAAVEILVRRAYFAILVRGFTRQ